MKQTKIRGKIQNKEHKFFPKIERVEKNIQKKARWFRECMLTFRARAEANFTYVYICKIGQKGKNK
jgi:hypothetical protein